MTRSALTDTTGARIMAGFIGLLLIGSGAFVAFVGVTWASLGVELIMETLR